MKIHFLAIFFSISVVNFTTLTPVFALSDNQSGAISQYCTSIKQTLKTLQTTDARIRSYLGNYYEKILSNYLAPFSLRLININQPNTTFTEIHSNLISERAAFIAAYTDYAKSFETLLSLDCQSDPAGFYRQLSTVRQKRDTLSATTTKIRNLLSEHLTAVTKLRASYADKDAS